MIINIEKLTKKYDNKIIFKNFNLQINKKDFLWIYGESGAGKSTLLNIIGMLDDEYEGSIEILGHKKPKISKVGQKILRTDLSYLFQNYGLIDNETVFYNFNIVENIKRSKNKKIKIKEILKFLGLEHIDLKQHIYTLSGGEQQRIAIGKIIAKNPKIILCDEPTGSLDKENSIKIMEILKRLNENGTTVVVVSHDNIIEEYFNRKIKI